MVCRGERRALPPPPPPLPLRLLPSCPLAPGPLPGALSLTRLRSPRRAPLPPPQALAPRSFQLSKRQPRPRPHRPGTPPAPARPAVPVPPPPLARRLGCPLARSRARPPGSACAALCASGTAAAAAAAGLLGAQPNVATRARERSGRQRPEIDRRFRQSARGGGPGAAREGCPVSARPLHFPLRPPPRSRCPCSCGEPGVSGGASFFFLGRPAPGPPSCPVWLLSAGLGAPRCELGG